MRTIRVTEWIDIRAPRADVFDLIVNIKRRMQLSPLWGIANIKNLSHNYPQAGSRYDVEIQGEQDIQFETIITDFTPEKKLAYKSLIENNATVTWNFQDVKQGTRVIYTEEFLVEDQDDDEARQSVQKIVKEWLTNMRRYAELRDTWAKQIAKKLIDRFYIDQTPPQRKTITTILFMQSIGTITFIMAALALGFANLLK